MKLILDCFKRIFEALAGIYTKQETDSALAVKADKADVEAEATSRQEADTELGGRIDANAESAADELAKMRRVINEIGEVIWFTLTIPEDDGTHERWITDDGTHESDNNPPTFARYYDCEAWTVRTSSGGVGVVDWGDGFKDEVSSPSADFILRHKYYSAGTYEFVATGSFSQIKLKTGANNFSEDSNTRSRMRDFSPVFRAATIKGCSVYSVMQGATIQDWCYVVNPRVGFTCGMEQSPLATINAANANGFCFHSHKVSKIVAQIEKNTTERVSFYSARDVSYSAIPTEYVIDAPSIKSLNAFYFAGSGAWFNGASSISIFAPTVEKANGANYNSFYNAQRLKDFKIGITGIKFAKNAFYDTTLNAESVVRILKALPDLSADTEHLPDNTLGTSDAYYGYRIITFTTDKTGAAVKAPTAEMWAAYDEAVAKGWLVEGFEGTHP